MEQKSLNYPGMNLAPHTEYKEYPVHLERLNWLFKTIQETRPPGKKIKILDVGCGTGNITIPLGLIPDSEVLGIDLDHENVRITSEKNKFSNVEIKFSYVQDVDLKDVDYLIMTEVMEHIPNYFEILQDIAKRRNPNLKMLITIPNGWGPFEVSQTPMYWLRAIGLNGFIKVVKKILGKKEPYATNQEETPHVNFFTMNQLNRDFSRLGMKMTLFQKAFVISPILETYMPFISLKKIGYYDNLTAQKLPVAFASGWYFVVS